MFLETDLLRAAIDGLDEAVSLEQQLADALSKTASLEQELLEVGFVADAFPCIPISHAIFWIDVCHV